MSAIHATGLRRTFGATVAVDTLDLDVADGEIFGLVGPDGAGKTTTMRMLTGILSPTAGSATVAGCDVVRQAERLKDHIGYMSQRFGLYPDLTVIENILFYADIYGVAARGRADKIERLLGFSNSASHAPSSTRRACCSLTNRPTASIRCRVATSGAFFTSSCASG
jgi:ABC-2 type transport system ATP-binding protein